MRNIKSYTIGLLTSFTIILLTGWTGYDMGDITCKTITLVDADGNIYGKLDETIINKLINNNQYINVLEYNHKIDSLDNKFQKIDSNIKKVKQDLTKGMQDLSDDIEDNDDDLRSLKTHTRKSLRKIDNMLSELRDKIEMLDK